VSIFAEIVSDNKELFGVLFVACITTGQTIWSTRRNTSQHKDGRDAIGRLHDDVREIRKDTKEVSKWAAKHQQYHDDMAPDNK